MRKPRDFDSELKALEDKARQLKQRKVTQLGELVIACGADALTADELAGLLLTAADGQQAERREGWAKHGAAFFLHRARRSAATPDRDNGGALPLASAAQPAPSGTREG